MTKAVTGLAPATVSEAGGVRFLHLDTPWVQGAMRIRKPLAIELEYVQRMMVWLLLRPAAELSDGHAVQLGLGAAAISRFTHGAMQMRTTAVEVNPSVIHVCRLCFHLPADGPLFRVLEADAGAFAAEPARAGTVQALCVDLYDHDAAAPVLDSGAFYADCHRLLVVGGVMTVNLFGRDASFARSAARVAAAFGHAAGEPAGERVRSLRPTREGNTVVAAVKGAGWPEDAMLAERAAQIEARFGLPARKWLQMIRPLHLDLPPDPAGGTQG